MSNIENIEIAGAEIKRDKNNQIVIGFSSQSISDEQLSALNTLNEDCLLAFYSCNFSNCNLEILKNSNFSRITLIYCQFGNNNFYQICELPKLTWLKLFDTQVTSEAVEKIQEIKSNLRILFN